MIWQRYSGKHLCKKHFIEDFEKKVRREIRNEKMIERGDRIAIALSGGKDSIVLTHLLAETFSSREDIEFIAITVDEGIRGYREHTVKIAKETCRNLDIEHIVVSFSEKLGKPLDEIVKEAEKKPCTYCGVFRKYYLNKTAREIGATKLALGHNLDDEVQTILMNFIHADISRLARLIPQKVQRNMVLRIKPLRKVYEKEVVTYALLRGFEIDLRECPYSHEPVRAVVRDFLNDFEQRYPGRKLSIMKSFEKLRGCLKSMYPQINLNLCRICGEPTSGDVCQACKLKEEIER